MKALIGKVAKSLHGTPKDKESNAWSLVALMVGAVMISRALPDDKDSRAALRSALKTAHALLD